MLWFMCTLRAGASVLWTRGFSFDFSCSPLSLLAITDMVSPILSILCSRATSRSEERYGLADYPTGPLHQWYSGSHTTSLDYAEDLL
ncbi:hypothetical protein BC629DRAFT_1457623 [Irpex lacteus]|nr:hypothetical protein BC629DRAFT_1457623 [Irpex lacteus]